MEKTKPSTIIAKNLRHVMKLTGDMTEREKDIARTSYLFGARHASMAIAITRDRSLTPFNAAWPVFLEADKLLSKKRKQGGR